MEVIYTWINEINDVLWTYILVALLLGCSIWFTIKTRFVQFKMLCEMVRLLGDSNPKHDEHNRHISAFSSLSV